MNHVREALEFLQSHSHSFCSSVSHYSPDDASIRVNGIVGPVFYIVVSSSKAIPAFDSIISIIFLISIITIIVGAIVIVCFFGMRGSQESDNKEREKREFLLKDHSC